MNSVKSVRIVSFVWKQIFVLKLIFYKKKLFGLFYFRNCFTSTKFKFEHFFVWISNYIDIFFSWKNVNKNENWHPVMDGSTHFCSPRVNFINILRLHFSYKSLLSSFSLLRVWLKTNFCTKNMGVKHWRNWHLNGKSRWCVKYDYPRN